MAGEKLTEAQWKLLETIACAGKVGHPYREYSRQSATVRALERRLLVLTTRLDSNWSFATLAYAGRTALAARGEG